MSSPPSLSPAAIAMNRFGLGATPDEAPPADPKAWLLRQFDQFESITRTFAALPDAGVLVKAYRVEERRLRQADAMAGQASSPGEKAKPPKTPEQMAARKAFAQDVRELYRQAVQARVQSALETKAPFVERLVHFWSNHFCVSADNPQVTAYAGAFERDAIRPHVLGRFEDMLFAVEQHPAMLIYLNQIQSIGPDSKVAERIALRNPRQKRGLNENLGREIMELHTLGVRSGYSQADVTEFARALTGWTVDGIGPQGRLDNGNPDDFIFRPQLHEPGPRTILGKTYRQANELQARAALMDFAHAPPTAIHVATKLARHFAGDIPPPALVDRLTVAFMTSRGDLPTVYKALIDSPDPWQPRPLKFKSPWEWAISSLRGLGRTDLRSMQIAPIQNQLGQPVWRPGSPAGWDDTAATWAAPDALLRRVECAQRLVVPVANQLDARQLVPRLLPASFSKATAEQVARAESSNSALALLLVSPDFLRR
ncbi:MAG: DUF1800 domain-containing protein [Terriglobia bacterium]